MEIRLHDNLGTCRIEFNVKVFETEIIPLPTTGEMDPSAILTCWWPKHGI